MLQHCRHHCIPLIGFFLFSLLTLFSPTAAGASGLTYTVTLEPGQFNLVTQDGQTRIVATDRQYYMLSDEGLPELPYRLLSFVLPQNFNRNRRRPSIFY